MEEVDWEALILSQREDAQQVLTIHQQHPQQWEDQNLQDHKHRLLLNRHLDLRHLLLLNRLLDLRHLPLLHQHQGLLPYHPDLHPLKTGLHHLQLLSLQSQDPSYTDHQHLRRHRDQHQPQHLLGLWGP